MKRMTKQRKAILECLESAKRPLCIEEILSYTSLEIPQINLSTVYRNIKMLLEENLISLVELPGENPFYEIQHTTHHHYFLCSKCSKTYSIQSCPKGLLDMVPKGFLLLNHSITLHGFCRDCYT